MFNIIRVCFHPETAIVGCEIEPYVQMRHPDGSTTTLDLPEFLSNGRHFLRCKWYRIEKENKSCSIHPEISATIQCTSCIKANVAKAKSYHCSTECFSKAWKRHLVLHEIATNSLKLNCSQVKPLTYGSNKVIKKSGETWYEVGHYRTYTPTADDEGCILRLECTVIDAVKRTPVGQPAAVFTLPVNPAPYPVPRQMVPARLSRGYGGSESFTVLSYNLLSDVRASSEAFKHCPFWSLSWSYRRQNLLREIVGYQADILCLQEVQYNHFSEFFAPELEKLGYQGEFKRKTSEIIHEKSNAIDGCATFFRRDRFKLCKRYDMEFNKRAMAFFDRKLPLNKRKFARNRFFNDNIALLVLLEPMFSCVDTHISRDRLLCVANTHITVDDDHNDVKLLQVRQLVRGLESIAQRADISIVICGDFNSLPGSSTHSLVTTGKVDPRHPDLAVDPLGILRLGDKYFRQFPLVSAYSCMEGSKRNRHVDTTTNEPLFTHSTSGFCGTVDYIFYSADSLMVNSLLELLPQDTALPSPLWSSDHIALLAQFHFDDTRPMLRN